MSRSKTPIDESLCAVRAGSLTLGASSAWYPLSAGASPVFEETLVNAGPLRHRPSESGGGRAGDGITPDGPSHAPIESPLKCGHEI